MTGWGDMVFQLFESQVPDATGRFITLAQSGFYNAASNTSPITIHRVIDDFVFQFGDPTGTGAGGSTLGNFNDDFDPDLQHNTRGALSWAKSTDDTNNSQVFVTDVPTRYLDFNHSYFGQLTEGDKVRDGITATATDSSDHPSVAINIESVSIFQDIENGMLVLKAAEGASGAGRHHGDRHRPGRESVCGDVPRHRDHRTPTTADPTWRTFPRYARPSIRRRHS